MERVIRGTVNRRVQLQPVNKRGWTKARRGEFLDMLAATCNVTASVAQVGLTKKAAYDLRRRDPEFAALWRSAILTGYDRLEEMLIDHAGAGLNDVEPGNTEIPSRPFDPRLAMDLLKMHRATVENSRKRLGGRVERMSREEAEAKLLRKLDMLAKRLRDEAGE